MENENVSSGKLMFVAIFLITFSSFCAFLIGLGINSGSCPVCKEKSIVKVLTTVNNVVSDVDYNMLTSDIKKDLVGKYVNQIDESSYFEIFNNGKFEFVRNSCSKYEKFTDDDYVLLVYYARKENTSIDIEDDYIYETILTLIPKFEIDDDNLIDSMITFNVTMDELDNVKLKGPVTCSSSNIYIMED